MKSINVRRTGVLETFEKNTEMREYLRERKWEGNKSEALEISSFVDKRERKKLTRMSKKSLKDIIMSYLDNGEFDIEELIEKLEEHESDEFKIINMIEILKEEGEIYNPKSGTIAKVR